MRQNKTSRIELPNKMTRVFLFQKIAERYLRVVNIVKKIGKKLFSCFHHLFCTEVKASEEPVVQKPETPKRGPKPLVSQKMKEEIQHMLIRNPSMTLEAFKQEIFKMYQIHLSHTMAHNLFKILSVSYTPKKRGRRKMKKH